VAALPAVGVVGRRAFVTDAMATTFQSIVAGEGTNKVPVFDDGTNWRIGDWVMLGFSQLETEL
jgi:hypothetical protein